MNSGSSEDAEGGVFVRLVEKKSGTRVEWVLEMTDGERAAADCRSLDCAGSFAIANDSASLGMTISRKMLATNCGDALGTNQGTPATHCDEALGMTRGYGTISATNVDETIGISNSAELRGRSESQRLARAFRARWPRSCVIPWMEAVADPREEWWELRRNSPKQSGEISQAAFLLRARQLGLKVALPWGDSDRFDFVVWREGGPIYRVQVKGTGRLHRRGYEVQPVHTARGGRKQRYTAKEIDVVAAHVQPVDVWYLLPIGEVGQAKSLRFYPDIESRRPMWEEYREAWEVLR
jgi:hypothetical protein